MKTGGGSFDGEMYGTITLIMNTGLTRSKDTSEWWNLVAIHMLNYNVYLHIKYFITDVLAKIKKHASFISIQKFKASMHQISWSFVTGHLT